MALFSRVYFTELQRTEVILTLTKCRSLSFDSLLVSAVFYSLALVRIEGDPKSLLLKDRTVVLYSYSRTCLLDVIRTYGQAIGLKKS